MLKLIAVIVFLALASVALAFLFRLSQFESEMQNDKTDRKLVLRSMIRKCLMLK